MTEAVETHGTSSRRDRLIAAAAKVRARGGFSADRAFQLAAWVLIPLGVVFILLGWYGASHTTRVWQQIPYMVSGGLLGLGLIFAGGFGYFAAWLTRMMEDSRKESAEAMEAAQRTLAALERIEVLLGGTSGNGAAMLVVAEKGTMVHRPDCPMIAGRSDLRRPGARDSGLRPCKVCTPDLSALRSRPRSRR